LEPSKKLKCIPLKNIFVAEIASLPFELTYLVGMKTHHREGFEDQPRKSRRKLRNVGSVAL
jgi:hypothetical protein